MPFNHAFNTTAFTTDAYGRYSITVACKSSKNVKRETWNVNIILEDRPCCRLTQSQSKNVLSSTWKQHCYEPTMLLTSFLFSSSHTGTCAQTCSQNKRKCFTMDPWRKYLKYTDCVQNVQDKDQQWTRSLPRYNLKDILGWEWLQGIFRPNPNLCVRTHSCFCCLFVFFLFFSFKWRGGYYYG